MSRYYQLMGSATAEFHDMSYHEKGGAIRILMILANTLWRMHFEEKLRLDVRTIVKTLDDIRTNLLEDLIHLTPPVDPVPPSLSPLYIP